MNIKKLYRLHKRLQLVRAWYFLALAAVFFVIAVYALRQNNYHMIRLRDAVTAADQQNGDVEKALYDLRKYVYSHMNTNLTSGKNAIRPPIQLKARYDRLADTEQQRVKALNDQVTSAAESICGQQYPAGGFNAPRVACVQEYVRTHAAVAGSVPDDLYKFDFLSPGWTPDLSGLSLLASGFFLFLFGSRIALDRWLVRRVK